MNFLVRITIKFLILLIILMLIGYAMVNYFVLGIYVERDGISGANKKNAIWLEHEWVGEPHGREEIHGLVSQLLGNQISLVFVHSGPFEQDGSIPLERYRYAESFLAEARQLAPEMEFHAWIGQVRDKLPIEDPQIRENIRNTAMSLVTETGFDGIHINIEPMHSDPDFATLLAELQTSLQHDNSGKLSAAVSPIVPELYLKALKLISNGDTFLGHDLNRQYSSLSYTKEITEYLDYVALMGYDTSFQKKDLYAWFLEQELILLLKAAPNKALMGIPSYEDVRPNFNSEIENVENALEGVKRGLSNVRTNPDKLVGLAIYANWTTDSDEWSTWQSNWLQSDPESEEE